MVDFLKQNPYVTRDEYMWDWSVPQIKLASYDFTHVRYLSEEEAKMRNAKVCDLDDGNIKNDLGIPIF